MTSQQLLPLASGEGLRAGALTLAADGTIIMLSSLYRNICNTHTHHRTRIRIWAARTCRVSRVRATPVTVQTFPMLGAIGVW